MARKTSRPSRIQNRGPVRRRRNMARAPYTRKFARPGRSVIESGSNPAGIWALGLAALSSTLSWRGVSMVPRDRQKAQLSKESGPSKLSELALRLSSLENGAQHLGVSNSFVKMKMPPTRVALAGSLPGAAPFGFKGAVFDFCRFIVRGKAPAAKYAATAAALFRTQSYRAQRPLAVLLSVIVVVACAGCHPNGKLPDRSSKLYADVVSAFYVGLAALQVGDDVHAENKLSEVTQLVPAEPAGWANWGVLALRQRKLDAAAQRFERARTLAPQNDHIYDLLGILESSRGHSAEAIADWRKATEINPRNYRAAYNLAEEIERQGGPNSRRRVPGPDPKDLGGSAGQSGCLSGTEPRRRKTRRHRHAAIHGCQDQRAVCFVAAGSATAIRSRCRPQRPARTHAQPQREPLFSATRLMRVPEFRESLAILKAPAGEEAEPFTHFLRLESPVFTPAPADTAIAFTSQPIAASTVTPTASHWNWVGAIALGSAGAPVVAEANGREVRLATGATAPVSRVVHRSFRHRPTAFCKSTSITISRPISCSRVRGACACCARTIRTRLPT